MRISFFDQSFFLLLIILQPEEGDLEGAVKYAIDVGYRHIDTAYLYRSEKGVGNAVRAKIQDGTVTREEMFITTKVK